MGLPQDVAPVAELDWEDEEDRALYGEMVERARAYLEGFRWCRSVRSLFGGTAVPGVVAVFLAEIVPAEGGVDDRLWVVIGDVPPAYLVLEDLPTSTDALSAYVDHMADWVDAVRSGQSVDDLIPVNVEPTEEWADNLAPRLAFLREKVIDG